ncbi:fumarylacetoacetate hydrolase family protein [Mycolicibacterium boenickei]|uniref:Fumarylacetoacetate hydrolase n=1 Tax=Mycolicibacterium boenickei TaxID=146017 RepID=A0AAX3A3N8_9MYCO|nr:fumarylacetoacetate hydrolase family protein [Mycolicibacterium boenickei]PEG61427.1 FAA hydrolase family protein [Mycolicibacterium boenickei]UNC02139.1 fumarylacetoacetate hydrolase family protein [Mycolicibacterium boenickei]BBX92101.1 fumarylacetoacetate hydrolase [Mycolicibacterium boenickei]
MKLANLDGRAVIVTDAGLIDIAKASGGSLPGHPDQAVAAIDSISAWLDARQPDPDVHLTAADLLADLSVLGPPVIAPRQIFAVGLNYAEHGAETGLAVPDEPLIFTKFASSITGPGGLIPLPTATCDWEVELVVVIGRGGRNIGVADALRHVAGYCIGQDISERRSQMAGAPPQFSLAKSHRGFSPIGPWVTTVDELPDVHDLAIATALDDEIVQQAVTSDMIFGVESLISHLSTVCELLPGDLIFTGTPAGVGYSRTPARYLTPGTVVRSTVEGLGELRNPCVVAIG